MRYVLKNQEMQTVDHETIHGIGIPGLVLMERASKAVADKAAQIADHSQRILIISGIGNNGGPMNTTACTRNEWVNRQQSRAAALPAANQTDTMLKVIPSSARKPTAARSQKMGSMDIEHPSL